MAKQVTMYETDQVTPAETLHDEGTIRDGQANSPRRVWVRNTSTASETLEACRWIIEALGTNDGDDYLQLAPDVAGSPGSWTTEPIVIGDMAVNDWAACWMRYNIPAGSNQIGNPRLAYVTLEEA